MLLVKASAKPSIIHRIGLFADQKIPKETFTWKFDSRFDLLFDPEELEKMPELQRNFIDNYSYLSKKSHKHVFSIDDARFTNHSKNNNIDLVEIPNEPELCGVANRDIEIGEELFVNYRILDAYDEKNSEPYLNS
jgi:uncharacterized protein